MNNKDKSETRITIETLKSEKEEEFLKFLKLELKGWHLFKNFWDWRKLKKTYSGGDVCLIALNSFNGILGTINLVSADIRCDGKRIKTSWQQDSLVSSSARGMGIGKKIVIKGNESCELNLAKGTSSSMYGLRKSLGYQDVPNSNYLIRACRFGGIRGGLAKKIVFLILRYWSILLWYPKTKKNLSIQKIDEFDDSFDELAESFSEENTIHPVKGKDFLNWRYTQCPGKKYTILKAGLGKTTRGAIVLNCSGHGLDEGWVVDMLCKPDDKDCAFVLIKAAMSFFKKNKVSRSWCFATHPAARKWFYRFGYLPTNQSPRFTYFTNNTEFQKKLSGSHWFFWHGDGDIELYQ